MKVYFGLRTSQGCQVFHWDTLDPIRPVLLDQGLDLWNHSPNGFEWGYGGSGSAQLALALLMDATGDGDFAVTMHQDVKAALIASLPREVWARTELDVLECALRVARTPQAQEQARHYLNMAKQRKTTKGGKTDAN